MLKSYTKLRKLKIFNHRILKRKQLIYNKICFATLKTAKKPSSLFPYYIRVKFKQKVKKKPTSKEKFFKYFLINPIYNPCRPFNVR